MLTAVHGDDAGAVNHLDADHDVSRALENLKRVVVDDGKVRRPVGADDAAERQRGVEVVLRQAFVESARRFGARDPSPFPFRRQGHQRRNSSVRRIDDERRSPIGGDFQPFRIHPMLVVRAVDVRISAPVAAIARQAERQLRREFGGLFIGQHRLAIDGSGTLQRRAGGDVPDPVQVRIAPRRAWRRPGLRRRFRGGWGSGRLAGDADSRQSRRDDHRKQNTG